VNRARIKPIAIPPASPRNAMYRVRPAASRNRWNVPFKYVKLRTLRTKGNRRSPERNQRTKRATTTA
jgi:hypothetical protein